MAVKRKKILIVTDDAGESYEILYAKHRFEEEGWTAHICATKKKSLNKEFTISSEANLKTNK